MTSVLDTLARPVLVNRIVYATITVMSVLIIYDGWQKLRLIDVVLVIVGPIIAMFIGHIFSAALAKQIEVGRPLSRTEGTAIVGSESRFLLLAVPPVAIVCVLYACNVSLAEAIRITLLAEAASLGYWGFVAARRGGIVGVARRGLRRRRPGRRIGGSAPPSGTATREGFLRRTRNWLISDAAPRQLTDDGGLSGAVDG